MINIGISEFRSNMHQIIQRVQQGETVTLTQRGVEVARLVPPDLIRIAARVELKRLQETAEVGDVISSLHEAWDADV
ncbi:MAG: type II toxin-antitoxin system prevent-host-death family antitoxin [Caldilineales bacterium]|nr:type II toxin-antitoxin system prevent-host-death family antitoxin [Caldilineales bacterium]